jgi:hypothetical protein
MATEGTFQKLGQLEMWEFWAALGWSPRDAELLRAHGKALGIEVEPPPFPKRLPAPPTAPAYSRSPTPQEEKVPLVIENFVNHIVIVLDASSSMADLRQQTINVVDGQIAYMAESSKVHNQETRVTVIVFADEAQCIIWEMDVLRLPSIAEFYKPYGNTALVDATLLAIDDQLDIPTKYGDHAFLVYVFTDGQENASGKPKNSVSYYWRTPQHLIDRLNRKATELSKKNWTLACFVPDRQGITYAKSFGFPEGNIATWDATSERGMREAGEVMRRATDSYMEARSTGTRSTTNLFDIGANVVNAQAILDAGMAPVPDDDYDLIQIGVWPGQVKPADYDEKKRRKPWKSHGGRIDEFVQNVRGGQYIAGQAYYQLVEGKTERIQASKKIAVVNKKSDKVYTGPGARKLLGLPSDMECRVKPSASDEYLVYVQSKSPNRLLVPGCRLLIMKK